VRNLWAQAGQEWNMRRPVGRPAVAAAKSLDKTRVSAHIGLFCPPHTDVICVQPGVSMEKFQ